MSAHMKVVNNGRESISVLDGHYADRLQIRWVPVWSNATSSAMRNHRFVLAEWLSDLTSMNEKARLAGRRVSVLSPGDFCESDNLTVGTEWGMALHFAGEVSMLQPILYLGDGRIVRGEPVSIRVNRQFVSDCTKVLSYPIAAAIQGHVVEASIDSERFLFLSTNFRFCRIPPETTYSISHRQESDSAYLTVRFEGKYAPLEFRLKDYQVTSGDPETVPWIWARNQRELRRGRVVAPPSSVQQ